MPAVSRLEERTCRLTSAHYFIERASPTRCPPEPTPPLRLVATVSSHRQPPRAATIPPHSSCPAQAAWLPAPPLPSCLLTASPAPSSGRLRRGWGRGERAGGQGRRVGNGSAGKATLQTRSWKASKSQQGRRHKQGERGHAPLGGGHESPRDLGLPAARVPAAAALVIDPALSRREIPILSTCQTFHRRES